MPVLKNLTSLKRAITRHIREAFEELHENLGSLGGNLERAPIPERIKPFPVREGAAPFRGRGVFPRNFCQSSVWRTSGVYSGVHFNLSSRFFSTYNKFGGFNSWRWARTNRSVLFQNFSSKSQFRLKLFHRFYRTPTLTELLKMKTATYNETSPLTSGIRTAAAGRINNGVITGIRLNLLLTAKFHDLVLDLARSLSAQSKGIGCYVDFKIEPKILIPSATMMSAEVVNELLANLKRFERHIAALLQDLLRLSDLGELPLNFVESKNVIRVFFPNCDRAQLECLLVEKNVLGGVIYEDQTNTCEQLQNDALVTSIADFDILSSCNSLTLALSDSASSGSDDILSLSGTNSTNCHDSRIVHLAPVAVLGHLEFADDYFWA